MAAAATVAVPFAFGIVVISVAASAASASAADVGGGVDDIVRVLTGFTLQLFYLLFDVCVRVCVINLIACTSY